MPLTRLLWTAVATPRLADADLRRTLAEYRHANDRDAVTGIILYDSPHLAGCAEGSRMVVSRLLKRLANDPAFGGFQLVSCCDITTRAFGYWNSVAPELAGEPADGLRPLYRLHGTDIPFRPAQLSAERLFGLLRDMYQTFDDLPHARSGSGSPAGIETLLDAVTKRLTGPPAPVDSVT